MKSLRALLACLVFFATNCKLDRAKGILAQEKPSCDAKNLHLGQEEAEYQVNTIQLLDPMHLKFVRKSLSTESVFSEYKIGDKFLAFSAQTNDPHGHSKLKIMDSKMQLVVEDNIPHSLVKYYFDLKPGLYAVQMQACNQIGCSEMIHTDRIKINQPSYKWTKVADKVLKCDTMKKGFRPLALQLMNSVKDDFQKVTDQILPQQNACSTSSLDIKNQYGEVVENVDKLGVENVSELISIKEAIQDLDEKIDAISEEEDSAKSLEERIKDPNSWKTILLSAGIAFTTGGTMNFLINYNRLRAWNNLAGAKPKVLNTFLNEFNQKNLSVIAANEFVSNHWNPRYSKNLKEALLDKLAHDPSWQTRLSNNDGGLTDQKRKQLDDFSNGKQPLWNDFDRFQKDQKTAFTRNTLLSAGFILAGITFAVLSQTALGLGEEVEENFAEKISHLQDDYDQCFSEALLAMEGLSNEVITEND